MRTYICISPIFASIYIDRHIFLFLMWIQAPHELDNRLHVRLYEEDDALLLKGSYLRARDLKLPYYLTLRLKEQDTHFFFSHQVKDKETKLLLSVQKQFYLQSKEEQLQRPYERMLIGTRGIAENLPFDRLEFSLDQMPGLNISKRFNPLFSMKYYS
mgnify:CR=1 FL=1